jgi:hypothetical protein
LLKDPGPGSMQIAVVDDASSEDVAGVVRTVAGTRVDVFRHERNLGHVAAFNDCLFRSRGRFVHLLHADDAVRPGFYERLAEGLGHSEDVGAGFCRYVAIGPDGNWLKVSPLEQSNAGVLPGWLRKIAAGQRLQPPCMAVKREVYERLGGFDTRIHSYGEDWEMWTRIAAHFSIWFEPEPLALYRVGGNSLSHGALRTGDNVRELLAVIEMNRDVLPAREAAEITRAARRETALTAIRRGRRLAGGGEYAGALQQARAALVADHSPAVLARLTRALLGVTRTAAGSLARRVSRRRETE